MGFLEELYKGLGDVPVALNLIPLVEVAFRGSRCPRVICMILSYDFRNPLLSFNPHHQPNKPTSPKCQRERKRRRKKRICVNGGPIYQRRKRTRSGDDSSYLLRNADAQRRSLSPVHVASQRNQNLLNRNTPSCSRSHSRPPKQEKPLATTYLEAQVWGGASM